MNIKPIITVVKMGLPLIGSFKDMLFVDGKFNRTRALSLILFLLVIVFSIDYIGVDGTNEAVDLLDEISDIIGDVD